MLRAMVNKQTRQLGMALIAVLWIVAALSIAVGGLVQTLRSETRTVASARRTVELRATGEAAVALALQKMTAPQGGGRLPWLKWEMPYDNKVIVVEAHSLNGFVDINRAGPELLAVLFTIGGEIDASGATALAQATVQARQHPDAVGRAQGFEVIQDLMRVPGFTYDLYAKIKSLITVDAQGGGKVNPQAAPLDVLRVLADGNAARASSMASARSQGGTGMDSTTLRGDFIDSAVGTRYRFQAFVLLADGSLGVVSCNVDLNADQRAGLPWRILSTEIWVQPAQPKDA